MTSKLAFYLPNLGGGGAERMMVNLAHGLTAQGLRLDIVLASATGPFIGALPGSANIIDLKAKSVLRSVPGLARYLRRHQPEVLLSTLHYANLAALSARRLVGGRTRVFLREANMLSIGNTDNIKTQAILALVKQMYPWSDGVIAVSQGVAEDVRSFVPLSDEKVHTVYNPVITEDLFKKCQEMPAHPFFEQSEEVVLGVGRLTKQKDFSTLIRAFAEVRRKRVSKLIILGEGEQRTILQALIAELNLGDDVDMPGFVENPFSFMNRSSVFVLSSAWEGLPGVLIQALACGCPVVSTNCPSGPQEVLEAGRYGSLVPVGDVKEMARAILDSLSAPLEKRILVQRAQAFSVEASTKAYLEIFNL